MCQLILLIELLDGSGPYTDETPGADDARACDPLAEKGCAHDRVRPPSREADHREAVEAKRIRKLADVIGPILEPPPRLQIGAPVAGSIDHHQAHTRARGRLLVRAPQSREPPPVEEEDRRPPRVAPLGKGERAPVSKPRVLVSDRPAGHAARLASIPARAESNEDASGGATRQAHNEGILLEA